MTETIEESVLRHPDQHQDTIENFEADITDPHCVAEKPYVVTFQDITSAAFLIKSGIDYTPCTV